MEQISIDKKGRLKTQAVQIDVKTAVSNNRFLKEFLFNENLETYDDFLEAFLFQASMMVDKYEITDEIKFILVNFYNQISGREFYKIDPGTNQPVMAEERDRQKGIYVAGATGTGKTTFCKILFDMVSNCVLKYIVDDRVYHYNTHCVSEYSINREYMKTGTFDYMKRSCLLIDDIGQAKEIQYMGNKLDPMREIITERYDHQKHTFTSFTSNYPINHKVIKDQYGERVFDRIQAMANYYIINSKNFRNG